MWSKTYIELHVKYPLCSSDFNENRIFSIDFRKSIQTSNFMKIRPVGAELLYEGGQPDGDTRDEANWSLSQLRARI